MKNGRSHIFSFSLLIAAGSREKRRPGGDGNEIDYYEVNTCIGCSSNMELQELRYGHREIYATES